MIKNSYVLDIRMVASHILLFTDTIVQMQKEYSIIPIAHQSTSKNLLAHCFAVRKL